MKPTALKASWRIAAPLFLLAALICALLLFSPVRIAYAQDLTDKTGVTRSSALAQLVGHENDWYYLGTEYHAGQWMSPNGDTSYNGSPGMNCTGFVAYVMTHAGMSEASFVNAISGDWRYDEWGICAASNWMLYVEKTGLEQHRFSSKAELLASGKAEKGDIVLMWKGYVHELQPGADNHIGFFWGSASGDDWMWHSFEPCNQLGPITPKSPDCSYVLIKLHDLGAIDLKKTSALPSATEGNTDYSLAGAVYGVYSNAACTNEVTRITTDASASAKTGSLKTGTYYVKEISAPKGYRLDATVYTVAVTADQTARVGGSSVKDTPYTGGFSLKKASSNAAITADNACYSLEGALYEIFSDKACTVKVDEMLTDAIGKAQSTKTTHPAGTYYIKEKRPPQGYALDTHTYSVDLTLTLCTAEIRANISVLDKPQNNPLELLVGKIDAETTRSIAQGGATFKGAQFTVEYHAGYFSTDDPSWIETTVPARTWVFETDEEGKAYFSKACFVSGDAFYTSSDNTPTLPLGTVVIRETKAPSFGYFCDPTIHIQQITAGGSQTEQVASYSQTIAPEQVYRGGLSIMKFIEQDLAAEGQPEVKNPAKGVSFTIYNDNEFAVMRADGTLAEKKEPVTTIVTDSEGYAATGPKELPYGTYVVKEDPSTTPEGYTPIADFKITISEDAKIYRYVLEDKLVNAPVKIRKIDTETKAQIPAQVSYGLFDKDKNRISFTTYYPETEVHDTFTAAPDGSITFPEPLLAGRYFLREIQAPEGYVLSDEYLAFDIAESTNWDAPVEVDFENEPIKGEIIIVKSDELTGAAVEGAEYSVRAASDIVTPDGTLRVSADDIVASGVVTDTEGKASVTGLYLGTYKVYETKAPQGYALDTEEHLVSIQSQGQDVATVSMRAELTDRPTAIRLLKTDGATKEPLAGARYRIWQPGADPVKAYDIEKIEPAVEGFLQGYLESEDATYKLDDREQSLRAFNAAGSGETVAFTFTVKHADGSYQQFKYNAKFGDEGVIEISHEQGTPLSTIEPASVSDPDAFDYTAETDEEGCLFLPYLKCGTYLLAETDAPHGYALPAGGLPLSFKVDDQGLIEGSATFEVAQDNFRISIGTTATGFESGTHTVPADEKATIVDTVAYENLTPGKEYKLVGTLMNKATGEPLEIDGIAVEPQSATFIPETGSGSEAVSFAIDARGLVGIDVVVFETLYLDDEELVVHADIDNEDQTVTIAEDIEIGTSALDKDSQTSTIIPADKVTVVDTIAYRGLSVGKKYEVRGILMDKATGKPLRVNEEEVQSEPASFVPDTADGFTTVEFIFDASALNAGTALVAFETLYYEGQEIAVHADIEDIGQTVTVGTPEIGTKAVEKEAGAKSAEAKATLTIVDTVTFKNLIPGKEYLLKGVLMHKGTGKALVAGGKEVQAELRFTPEMRDGSVDIEFTFDASSLAGNDLVAFEAVFDTEGHLIAEHQDLHDGDQTVTVVAPGTPYDKTGAFILSNPWIIPAVGLVAALSTTYGVRQLKKARRYKNIQQRGKQRILD